MNRYLKFFSGIIMVLLLSYWSIKPILTPGFFSVHDDTQPSRVFEMAKALKDGQFPVRWVTDLGYGYGYPLFNFYAPLPYYIGAVANISGADPISATKMMYLIGTLLAGVTMFYLVRSIAGNPAGIAAAVLFMYSPYHAVDIYVRGAVGEYYALAFLPLLLFGLNGIFMQSSAKTGFLSKKPMIIGSAGLAGILLSHNILGMMTGFFLIMVVMILLFSFFILRKGNPGNIFFLGAVIIFGLGISAFFTFPAIVEKGSTKVDQITGGYAMHFVYPDQLWNSNWGYGGSALGREDGMSFKIGKFHLLLGLLSCLVLLWYVKKKEIDERMLIFYLSMIILFVFSIYMMLEQSSLIWNTLGWFTYIQFPWRFLTFTVLTISILPAVLFLKGTRREKILMAVFIIVITLYLNIKYFNPKEIFPADADAYVSPSNLRYKISKISDEFMPPDFITTADKFDVAYSGMEQNDNLLIHSGKETSVAKSYILDVLSDSLVKAKIAYFPGFEILIDGQKAVPEDIEGRLSFAVSPGRHDVQIKLSNTPVRSLSNAISIFTIFLLVYVSFFLKGDEWQKKFQSIS